MSSIPVLWCHPPCFRLESQRLQQRLAERDATNASIDFRFQAMRDVFKAVVERKSNVMKLLLEVLEGFKNGAWEQGLLHTDLYEIVGDPAFPVKT